MKPFRFSLAKVLQVREIREETARLEWAQAVETREAARQRLAAVEETLAAARRQLTALSEAPEGIDPVQWRSQSLYTEALREMREGAREDVERAEAEAESAREQLVEAARARKVMEALREQEWRRHQMEVARLETAFLDEVGITRHRRGKAEPAGGRKE